MRKALTIGLAAAAITAALSLNAIGAAEREAATNAGAGFTPYFQRGPRIIHVPQPGERQERTNEREENIRTNSRASVNTRGALSLSDENDDDIAPPPHRRAIAPKHRSDATPPRPRKPRWAPSAAPPPPPPPQGPRRAVLSAPPPRAEGPTPIRPIPRFEAKANPAEKFTAPYESAVSSSARPLGTTAPAQNDATETTTDQ